MFFCYSPKNWSRTFRLLCCSKHYQRSSIKSWQVTVITFAVPNSVPASTGEQMARATPQSEKDRINTVQAIDGILSSNQLRRKVVICSFRGR